MLHGSLKGFRAQHFQWGCLRKGATTGAPIVEFWGHRVWGLGLDVIFKLSINCLFVEYAPKP